MKRLTALLILCMLLGLDAYAGPPTIINSGTAGILTDSNCDQAKYYSLGTLCQDTDDGKLYKGTGSGVEEIAAGSSGDMTATTYVTDGKIKTATGGTGLDTSGSTGYPSLSSGTWSILSASDLKTALGLVIGTNVQAYDADLTTYAGITPSANVQTLLGAADYAAFRVSLGVMPGSSSSGTFMPSENLDMSNRMLMPPRYTVATLPTAPSGKYPVIIVTDGADATDCETTGGGTTVNFCRWDGTNWVVVGGGGGGVETASDCSTYTELGQLCQDTDDNVLYIGTGSGVTVAGTINLPACEAGQSFTYDAEGALQCVLLAVNEANEGAIVKMGATSFVDATAGTDYYSPTEPVTLVAGTANENTAPLYFQAGTDLTTPEAGAMEFDGTNLYFTPSDTRKTIAYTDSNISGTAGNLSGTPDLPNGTTATTQSASDNSTKLATTAYVDAAVSGVEGGSGLSAWAAKTTTYTAASGDRIIADTSAGAWTLTLPATPSLGDEVDIIDGAGSWNAYNLTIGRNSTKINGIEADLTLNVSNAHVKLVYYDATNGWRVLNW